MKYLQKNACLQEKTWEEQCTRIPVTRNRWFKTFRITVSDSGANSAENIVFQ